MADMDSSPGSSIPTSGNTKHEGISVISDRCLCIKYQGTRSAYLAAEIVKSEWLEELGIRTRQVIVGANGQFTTMHLGAGNWITNERRKHGAYSIKQLPNGLIEVTVYRTPEEVRAIAAERAATQARSHLESRQTGMEAVIPKEIVERFWRLSREAQVHASARLWSGIEEAERMYPSARQRQISANRSTIKLAWKNPVPPLPGAVSVPRMTVICRSMN